VIPIKIQVTGCSQFGKLDPLHPKIIESMLTFKGNRASVWIAGSLAIWSIAASLVVHRSAVGHNIKHSAMVINILGIGTPLAVLAVALPIGILGGRSYERVLTSTRTIVQSLEAKGQAWSPGDSFTLASLASDAPAFQKLVTDIESLGSYAKSTYTFYSVAALALLIALLSIGSYYIFTLRRLLSRSSSSFDPGFTSSPAHKRVKRTLDVSNCSLLARIDFKLTSFLSQSLIMILFAFSLLAGGCFAVSVYGAINPLLLNRTSVSTAVSVAPLYLFAVLGLPCAILLVRGALGARESDKQIVESLSKQDRERESSSRRKLDGKPTSKNIAGLSRWREDDEDYTTESGLNTVVVTIDVQVQVDEEFEMSEKGSSLKRSKSDLL